MIWTNERLDQVVRTRLRSPRLVVIGGREPYVHVQEGETNRCCMSTRNATLPGPRAPVEPRGRAISAEEVFRATSHA
jgi:hypothetical protein